MRRGANHRRPPALGRRPAAKPDRLRRVARPLLLSPLPADPGAGGQATAPRER